VFRKKLMIEVLLTTALALNPTPVVTSEPVRLTEERVEKIERLQEVLKKDVMPFRQEEEEGVSLTQAGVDLIKKSEGLRLRSYRCPSGKLTIGYGHTGKEARRGRITKLEAENLLEQDLVKYERVVKNRVKVRINNDQYTALVSFTFNIGEGAFSRSSLLRKLNNGDFCGASKEFKKWVKGNNERILGGLVKRRQQEQDMFLTGLQCK
jgi:lysozyme